MLNDKLVYIQNNMSWILYHWANIQVLVSDDEIQLPIKLPPDLTIVKEVVSLDPLDPLVTPVKRGRGRPKKTPLAANTSIVVQQEKVVRQETPLPRRGRPKKTSSVLSIELPLVVKETPPTPRRGRPKKVPVIPIASPVTVKQVTSVATKSTSSASKSASVSVITTSAGSEYLCSMCPRVFSSEFVSFEQEWNKGFFSHQMLFSLQDSYSHYLTWSNLITIKGYS